MSVDEVMGIHQYDPAALRGGALDAGTGARLVHARAAGRRRSHGGRARWLARAGLDVGGAGVSYDERSLFALFQQEAKAQSAKLASGLDRARGRQLRDALEELMRAAHSLKGAARIVGHEGVAAIAHELEECFVAAQAGLLSITATRSMCCLRAVDLLAITALQDPEEALQHELRHGARGSVACTARHRGKRDEPRNATMTRAREKRSPQRSARVGEVVRRHRPSSHARQ